MAKKASRKSRKGKKPAARKSKRKPPKKKAARRKPARGKKKPARKKVSRTRVKAKKTVRKKTSKKTTRQSKKKAAPKTVQRAVIPKHAALPSQTAFAQAVFAAEGEERLGTIKHYYSHLGVAVIHLDRGQIQVGDAIHVKGHTSDFRQTVESLLVRE